MRNCVVAIAGLLPCEVWVFLVELWPWWGCTGTESKGNCSMKFGHGCTISMKVYTKVELYLRGSSNSVSAGY